MVEGELRITNGKAKSRVVKRFVFLKKLNNETKFLSTELIVECYANSKWGEVDWYKGPLHPDQLSAFVPKYVSILETKRGKNIVRKINLKISKAVAAGFTEICMTQPFYIKNNEWVEIRKKFRELGYDVKHTINQRIYINWDEIRV